MEKRIIELYRRKFDDIRHEADGIEYWYARELMTLLDYIQWRNFENVVKKGMLSCKNNGISVERTEARGKLRESEKRLSQNIYERGVDDAGFGRIRSKGDQALFGGFTTKQMKDRLGVQDKRPLADFLPTLTIAAKNLATEMTNYNVEEKDLQGESAITVEHVENNTSVRDMLGQRGIKPEDLPASEDIKKLERRVKREEKKLAEQSGKLTNE